MEGQRGNISPTDCTGIQTEINISDRCGCLAKGTGPNPAPSPSTPTGPTDPTNVPTLFPTRVPTPFPTTISPSSQPSLQPSTNPSTSRPSTNPSTQPSLPQPSVSPTMVESAMPSVDERQFCNICRDGGSVGNGLAVIASVSNSTPPLFFTCDQVDALARNSAFTQDECFIFQALASAQDQCGCVGGPPSTPTTAPAALIPTLAPSTVPPTPNNPCNICGPGGAVKFLDNVIGSMTCLETQDMGLSGAFDSTTCIIYQGTASLIPPDICGCLGKFSRKDASFLSLSLCVCVFVPSSSSFLLLGEGRNIEENSIQVLSPFPLSLFVKSIMIRTTATATTTPHVLSFLCNHFSSSYLASSIGLSFNFVIKTIQAQRTLLLKCLPCRSNHRRVHPA